MRSKKTFNVLSEAFGAESEVRRVANHFVQPNIQGTRSKIDMMEHRVLQMNGLLLLHGTMVMGRVRRCLLVSNDYLRNPDTARFPLELGSVFRMRTAPGQSRPQHQNIAVAIVEFRTETRFSYLRIV